MLSRKWRVLIALLALPGAAFSQQATAVKGADERYKADILVVVAHPDDEGSVTPYLARAIYDLHKRVAVVFATRGGSGGNDYRREHGPAMADVREIEARQACAVLGITNVWFLGGKDTASQNVLNSLANWGHGANLEALVRIVRLTRPEVILAWMPGIFIGENHGDHQAAGVLATEAFDAAADPVAFPAQLAGASKRLEPYLENLTPWQPKKIYYFSDSANDKQFAGTGPSYSVREISPSQKKPYWRMAIEAAKPHLTQFPEDIQRLSSMTNEQLNKMMSDPNAGWWTDPATLTFGKSVVAGKFTDDVFSGITAGEIQAAASAKTPGNAGSPAAAPSAVLGGPWAYYEAFRRAHGLAQLPVAKVPEIGVKSGSTLAVPIRVTHEGGQPLEVTTKVLAPENWKVKSGEGTFALPAEAGTDALVEIDTPTFSKEELKKMQPQDVAVRVESAGKSIGEIHLRVKLGNSGLPQQ